LDLRTYYAPEVEERPVSLCWHEPARLAEVLRRLDPSTHFVQPHLRHILEAIRIGYTELGAVDWCTVVQVLRERRLLEECGDLQLLDEVLSRTWLREPL
jgi:replicative DNA helicase